MITSEKVIKFHQFLIDNKIVGELNNVDSVLITWSIGLRLLQKYDVLQLETSSTNDKKIFKLTTNIFLVLKAQYDGVRNSINIYVQWSE